MLRENGYPHASTTRASNRARDGEGIDVCNKDEYLHGRMQDDIQLKDTTCIDWKLLLDLEKKDTGKKKRRKVLIVKLGKTRKDAKRIHFGKFAVMFDRDYYQLLRIYNAAREYFKNPEGTSKEHNAYLTLINEFHDSDH
jgi:hypothetical protein